MQGDCDYSELVAEDAREEENVYNEIYNTVWKFISIPLICRRPVKTPGMSTHHKVYIWRPSRDCAAVWLVFYIDCQDRLVNCHLVHWLLNHSVLLEVRFLYMFVWLVARSFRFETRCCLFSNHLDNRYCVKWCEMARPRCSDLRSTTMKTKSGNDCFMLAWFVDVGI
jgi:hypothetical protein